MFCLLSSVWAKTQQESNNEDNDVYHYSYRSYVVFCSLSASTLWWHPQLWIKTWRWRTHDLSFCLKRTFEGHHVRGRSEAPSKNSFSLSVFKAQTGLLCLSLFKAIYYAFMYSVAVSPKLETTGPCCLPPPFWFFKTHWLLFQGCSLSSYLGKYLYFELLWVFKIPVRKTPCLFFWSPLGRE